MSRALKSLERELLKRGNKLKAETLKRYFRTAKGEYGEGDVFLGISVKNQRSIVRYFYDLGLNDLQILLNSKFHEFRFSALLILIELYNKADEIERKKIVNFYLRNIKNINNWDLVDLSSYKIIGNYFFDKDKKTLYDLATSDNLWKKRVAIISTLYFIKNNKFKDALKIIKILLQDKHDLIHKANGWMLREVGNRDIKFLESFLDNNIKKIPRTTLRYAIEKFSVKKRLEYLKK